MNDDPTDGVPRMFGFSGISEAKVHKEVLKAYKRTANERMQRLVQVAPSVFERAKAEHEAVIGKKKVRVLRKNLKRQLKAGRKVAIRATRVIRGGSAKKTKK